MITKINTVREKACLRMATEIVEKEQQQPQNNQHFGNEQAFYGQPNQMVNNNLQTNLPNHQNLYNQNQGNLGNNFQNIGNQGFQPYNPGNF
jgi:hypothetical protein